jgi:outer membrane protein TolC
MKRVVLLLLIAAGSVAAQTRDTLTLEDAVALGLANSRTLRASAERVAGAEARASEIHAGMLPSLKFEGSYRRLSDVDPFLVQLPILPQPIEISPTVLDNTSLRLGLQQPLFTGFRLLSNAQAADRLAEASISDHATDRADLVLNITAAYWTLYQTRETERFVADNVRRLKGYVQDIGNLLNAGMATRNDALKMDVQLSTARLSLIDARNDVQLAVMNLNTLLGRPVEAPLVPSSLPGVVQDSSSTSVDLLTAAALAVRPDLRALSSRVEASRASVRAAQAGWWPQLSLGANYYYSRPNQRYMPTRDEFKGTWDVGVMVTMDIWNWGQTARQTDQAGAALRQNELMYEQMRDGVALDVHRAALQVQAARERVDVANLGLEQAGENLRVSTDRFRRGLVTVSELRDAELALLQATITQSGARVEAEISRTRLARSLGNLGR